ncbi:unnamed protein product [Nezara viridula]|uniref:Uncharacterized protein n=1 Tax=Nezara viridula TaxID=85310 RepID=A0A9P0HIB5_NEZVI|nr:unnamed protein product [Nezara viridula]
MLPCFGTVAGLRSRKLFSTVGGREEVRTPCKPSPDEEGCCRILGQVVLADAERVRCSLLLLADALRQLFPQR